ncbi:unnamed protein product [Linum trigynum]|uniref:Retrotransposon gag domain-containing protein n=1 Tax=Linum trigynum TaxID=586398 RepID=A0AAV2D8A3_9ROSI
MTRSQSGDLLPLDQELERTCRNFKRALKARLAAEKALSQLQLEMADPGNHDVIPEEQTMGSYWTARAADMRSPIQHPHVPANNFEVSTSVITMLRGSVVFRGKEGECPRSHLRRFHELIDGIKINGVPADAIQLRYFPFTLEGQAKEWLDTQPPGSITMFANLADKFLTRYHPLSKTADLQKQITHFTQDEDETIRDAWERYNSLFLRCPNHGFNDAFKVGTFYHALFREDKQLIDSVCGGNMLTKTPPQLNQLFEEMAENGYDWVTARRSRRAPGRGVHALAPSHLIWYRWYQSWCQLLMTRYLHMFSPLFLDRLSLHYRFFGLFYARLCSFVTFQALAHKVKRRHKFQVNRRSIGD